MKTEDVCYYDDFAKGMIAQAIANTKKKEEKRMVVLKLIQIKNVKSVPFIGGANDGEYLPIAGEHMHLLVSTNGSTEIWSFEPKGDPPPTQIGGTPVEHYRLGKFATSSGGHWIFYCSYGVTNDEAFEELMQNYCP